MPRQLGHDGIRGFTDHERIEETGYWQARAGRIQETQGVRLGADRPWRRLHDNGYAKPKEANSVRVIGSLGSEKVVKGELDSGNEPARKPRIDGRRKE